MDDMRSRNRPLHDTMHMAVFVLLMMSVVDTRKRQPNDMAFNFLHIDAITSGSWLQA